MVTRTRGQQLGRILLVACMIAAVGLNSLTTSIAYSSAQTGATSDVAILTTLDGEKFFDACFILLEYGNVGCDENRDGAITFKDVPLGKYTVHQTQPLSNGKFIPDWSIIVDGTADAEGWETEYVKVQVSDLPHEERPIDVSLITRDPADGKLLPNACYTLVELGVDGCDDDDNGQVVFAQVPPGDYTVRQTEAPEGHSTTSDFSIKVRSLNNLPNGEIFQVPLGFVVRQAPETNAPNTLNVSLILIDYRTGDLVKTGVCAELVGASNVGCDEDLVDGQIDFLDVPAGGPYEVRFSNTPDDIDVLLQDGSPHVLYIEPDNWHAPVVLGFILLGDEQPPIVNAPSPETATLLLTLRGCPEGTDPNYTNPAAVCTVPLDAPDRASVTYPDAMSHETMIPVPGTPRQTDGTYQVTVPANTDLQVAYFEPEVRDDFLAVGQDSTTIYGNPKITLAPGATGHIYIYYYYTTPVTVQPTTSTGSATLLLTLRGCPEGTDPNYTNPAAACTVPLDAPDRASITYPDAMSHEMMISVPGTPRQTDGTYQVTVPANTDLQVAYFEPEVRDDFLAVGQDSTTIYGNPKITLAPGETGHIYIYYYYTTSAPVQPSSPSGSATMVMYMRGCPEGFDPNNGDFFASCTIPLDAPDASFLYHGGDGQGGMNIMWMDRQWDGGYIFNAGPYTMNVSLSGLAPVVRDGYTVIGTDSNNGSEFFVNLQNGETRQIWVFYYYWP